MSRVDHTEGRTVTRCGERTGVAHRQNIPTLPNQLGAEERALSGHRRESDQLVEGTVTMVGGSNPGASPSTLRSTCAAPSNPEVSAGTTSFAFGLSANFVKVSSWRIATRVGSGAAA